MHGIGIRSRMHGNGLDPHFMRRTVNAQRDFAAVGDKDFFDRHRLSNHQQWLVKFDRLPAFQINCGNRSCIWRDDWVHDLHRLNDQDGVTGLHLLANADERCSIGLRR